MTVLHAPRMIRPRWLTLPLLIGVLLVSFWLLATVTAPLMTAHDPLDMVGRRLQSPSWDHLLGTDALGRDVFSRTLHGARHSIPIAVAVVILAVAIGAFLGALAGFLGGLADTVIMRFVDVTLSFPPMLLAMAMAASWFRCWVMVSSSEWMTAQAPTRWPMAWR